MLGPTRRTLTLALTAGLVATHLALALLASGCGGDETDPRSSPTGASIPTDETRSPEDTIEALFTAGLARDGKTACSLVTRRGRSLIDSPSIRGAGNKACVKNVETYKDDEIDVKLISATLKSQTGNEASVEAVTREDGETRRLVIKLLKVDGQWLADDPGVK